MNIAAIDHRLRGTLLACALATLCMSGATLANEPGKADKPAPTKEMREKMAVEHEHMAACLRSDRPIAECREEMMKHHEAMHHEMHHEAMKESAGAAAEKQ